MIAEGVLPHVVFLTVYLVVLIGVGAVKARKVKSQEDFSLAGRGLPTFVLVGTLLATWIGTGSIFGNAQETFSVGTAAFLLPIAGGLGIVALYLLAPRIRRFGQFTIQDILEARFGPAARVFGTVTLLLAYVIIVSYQYRAGSAVLEQMVPDLGRATAICTVAAFVILYTALAGMFSVAYTDVANGILMAIGLAFAIPLLLDETGGFGAALDALQPEQRSVFGHYGWITLINVLLPPFLLLVGDANMVQRFFSARNPKSARTSAAWMFGGVLVLECAIILVALLGAALVAQGKLETSDGVGRHIVVDVAFAVLPSFVGALLVGTVVAVVVSTADSYLLSPATSMVRDVYQRFLRPDADEPHVVLVGRVVVVALGFVALALAFTSDEFFSVALFAYTIYGAGITPALLAAYFWRRATAPAAVASMVTGVGTALVWKGMTSGWIAAGPIEPLIIWAIDRGMDAVIPAVVVSFGVLIVVSLLTPAPSEEKAHAI